METSVSIALNKSRIKTIVFDLLAVLLVLFTPAFSHLAGLPLYLFEPMRIILILAVLHTNRINAWALAVLLPFISFATTSHPVFFKMLLIAAELSLNVWLFYLLQKAFRNSWPAVLFSILASKFFYYVVKYLLLSWLLLDGTLVATPFTFQVAVIIALSAYTFIITKFSPAQSENNQAN